MPVHPLSLKAGLWLGAASGALAVWMVLAFVMGWGFRFRLVGVTSFTALLSLSCLAFAISYNPRVSVPGALQVPVVFDNGTDLVIAAAPADLQNEAAAPTVEQVARNLRGGGRGGNASQVRVRLRRVEAVEPGLARPVVLAETTPELANSSLDDAS